MHRLPTTLRVAAVALVACALTGAEALAQEVRNLNLSNVPPDLIRDDAPPSPSLAPGNGGAARQANPAPVDLGERPVAYQPMPDASSATGPAMTPARRAAQAAQTAQGARVGNVRRVNPAGSGAGAERAVFTREPIRVALPVGRERLITLPAPAALHVPEDIESVMRLEVIDRTIYARALVPFTPLRIVAQLIDSGQQVPLDLEASTATAGATSELEVSVVDPVVTSSAAPTSSLTAGTEGDVTGKDKDADMVELTRHAARQLYAPRRLAWGTPNVHQVALETAPVTALMRGVDVETVPLGQWKSGSLYVTALRVTNRSRLPVELPLDNLRGRWLAATAQHGRLGPRGSEIDTTAIYLVCDRSFEACH